MLSSGVIFFPYKPKKHAHTQTHTHTPESDMVYTAKGQNTTIKHAMLLNSDW